MEGNTRLGMEREYSLKLKKKETETEMYYSVKNVTKRTKIIV